MQTKVMSYHSLTDSGSAPWTSAQLIYLMLWPIYPESSAATNSQSRPGRAGECWLWKLRSPGRESASVLQIRRIPGLQSLSASFGFHGDTSSLSPDKIGAEMMKMWQFVSTNMKKKKNAFSWIFHISLWDWAAWEQPVKANQTQTEPVILQERTQITSVPSSSAGAIWELQRKWGEKNILQRNRTICNAH